MSRRLRGLSISECVKVERRRHGMTLAEVADRVGVSRSHVHDIETGRRRPSLEVAERLGQVLGISHLPMRGFIPSNAVRAWATRTPEVGKLLEALAHFEASSSQIDAIVDHFMKIKD